jgi:hypothetical protein
MKNVSQLGLFLVVSLLAHVSVGAIGPQREVTGRLWAVGRERGPVQTISFSPRQIRYLTPYDLITRFHQVFPYAIASASSECVGLTEQNRPLVGDNSVVTGDPSHPEPSFGFVVWYSKCVNELASRTFDSTSEAEVKFAFGETLYAWLQQNHGGSTQIQWSDIPANLQDYFLREQIERMVGPEAVIQDFGNFASMDAYLNDRKSKAISTLTVATPGLTDVAKAFALAVGLSDEFLSY